MDVYNCMRCLLIALAIVLSVYIFVHSYYGTTKRRDGSLKKAVAEGHVVTAKRIKLIEYIDPITDMPLARGVYQYECNGKRHKYRYADANHYPPDELNLYYVHDPKKADVAARLTKDTTNWFLVYVAVAVIVFVFSVLRQSH